VAQQEIETFRGHVAITERRLSGVTFADALRVQSPASCEFVPTGPEDLFFEKVNLLGVSRDGRHALCVGLDRDVTTLIMDGQPIERLPGVKDVTIQRATEDFSRLILTYDWQFREFKRSAALVNEKGELVWLANGEDLRFWRATDGFDRFLFSRLNGKRTEFIAADSESMLSVLFSIRQRFQTIRVGQTNEDFTEVIWSGNHKRHAYEVNVTFKNDELIAEEDGNHWLEVSPDLSKVLVGVENSKRKTVSIWLNGERLFVGKKMLSRGDFQRDADLNWVAICLISAKGHKMTLWMLTPDGQKQTVLFDELDELSVNSDGIQAVYVTGEDKYELTSKITAEEEDDVEVTEELVEKPSN